MSDDKEGAVEGGGGDATLSIMHAVTNRLTRLECSINADIEGGSVSWEDITLKAMDEIGQVKEMMSGLPRRGGGQYICNTPGSEKFATTLMQLVAKDFGINPALIASRSRIRAVSVARQVFWWLGRQLGLYTLRGCAALSGRIDHSSVIYGVRRTDERMRHNEIFGARVRALHDLASAALKEFYGVREEEDRQLRQRREEPGEAAQAL